MGFPQGPFPWHSPIKDFRPARDFDAREFLPADFFEDIMGFSHSISCDRTGRPYIPETVECRLDFTLTSHASGRHDRL